MEPLNTLQLFMNILGTMYFKEWTHTQFKEENHLEMPLML